MKEGICNPTLTSKINTNIHQSDISDGLAMNNNNNAYNTDTGDNNIVNITKEYKNKNANNNDPSNNNHVNTTYGPNSQDHLDDKYYLNISDPDYTEDYFNLLESGVNSDKIILTIEQSTPLTVISPPTVPKDINQDGFNLY